MSKLGDSLAVIDGNREVLGLVAAVYDDGTVDLAVFPGDKLTAPVHFFNNVTPYTSKDDALGHVEDDGVPRVYAYPVDGTAAAPVTDAPNQTTNTPPAGA